MTLKQILMEGLPGQAAGEGVDCTLANTGASVISKSGGTCKFRAAAARQGAFGGRIVTSTAGGNIFRTAAAAAHMTMAHTAEISMPSPLPTGSNVPTIWTLMNSSGAVVVRLLVNASGQIIERRTGAVDVTMATGRTAGEKLRLEVWATAATSTTGQLHMRLLQSGTNTAIGTPIDVTNADLGTATLFNGDIGVTGTHPESYTVDFDSIQWDDGRASFIPEVSTQSLTVNLTGSVAQLIDARSSALSSGTATYAIAQTAGPAATPTEIVPGLWSVSPHASETLTYEVTGVGSAGAVDTATFDVSPLSNSDKVERLLLTDEGWS